jgi:hypothetical protein
MSEPDPQVDDPQSGALQRIRELHDRDRHARENAKRAPWWPRAVGLVLALVVVSAFMLGFDRFLAAVQRLLEMPAEPVPSAEEPMPVYVVPEPPPREPAPADR